ncbi:aryl-sulfate sulfotransferase [candidate division KSB1 bacterium]|nr:aryl-sulfate sulfotransferase [candidate division KSB1 bacterium]
MMKNVLSIFLLCTTIPSLGGIDYMFPPPGAKYVSSQSSIIIKYHGEKIPESVEIIGSRSGKMTGVLRRIEDDTWSYTPLKSFKNGETVYVTLPSFKTWQFDVAPEPDTNFVPEWDLQKDRTVLDKPSVKTVGHATSINGVSVPGDFPEIKVQKYGETAPGKLFYGSTFLHVNNYLIIMENDGTPYFYRKYERANQGSGEFEVQHTGILTFYLFVPRFYVAMDQNFVEIDTFSCKHGYTTDAHEMVLTEDNHIILIGLDPQIVDMSQLAEGGNENASVVGNHIQELNENGDVVFEWRSWDHFNITDARAVDFRAASIDYVHMNSISVDYDGHLVISSRHLDEVSKIDHNTGEFIWRMGGENNQFEFINESYDFSYQHDFRPVPGKPNHYTMFDNGNNRTPRFSRAVEYKLDPVNKTAEKVWEFRYKPDIYSYMMGCVQRLENGNTMINWSNEPPLFASEVTPAGDVVYECEVSEISSNRVRRYEWEGKMLAPYLLVEEYSRGIVLIFNKFGDTDVDYYKIYGDTQPDPVRLLAQTSETSVVLTELQNFTDWYFRVTAVDFSGRESGFSNTEQVNVSIIEAGQNLVINGDFSKGKARWSFVAKNGAAAKYNINEDQECNIQISSGGKEFSDVQLSQWDFQIIKGNKYRFEFDARADSTRRIEAIVVQAVEPYENYGRIGLTLLKKQLQHYVYDFTMEHPTDLSARVVFNCGIDEPNVYIDNISLIQLLDDRVQSRELSKDGYILEQNYPNPFNSRTEISFQIPKDEVVTLEIYNVMGQQIKTLVNGIKKSGNHCVTFDASELTTGLYFYKLSARSFSQVRKMLYVR